MKFYGKHLLSVVLVCAVLLSFSFSAAACEAEEEGYAVNENGMTYGTMLQAEELGEEPDLILAVGENNVTGYVKSSDLVDDAANPEEALRQTLEITEDYFIPLYASDGVTVIGRFRMSVEGVLDTPSRSAWAIGQKSQLEPPGFTALAQNSIMGEPGAVRARTTVETFVKDSRWTPMQVDTSRIGIQIRIWNMTTGAVVYSGGMRYNTSPTQSFSREHLLEVEGDDEYASKGIVKVWNSGEEYWQYGTFQSPVVQPNT